MNDILFLRRTTLMLIGLTILMAFSICGTAHAQNYPEQIIHNFTGTSTDGEHPYAGLLAVSGKLYGTTNQGGSNGIGSIYSVNPDGTGYQTLFSFGTDTDGADFPDSSLISVNGKLYGTTSSGGTNNDGTVFVINPDGTGYQILYRFGITSADGYDPIGLISVSGKLYGTTNFGGTNNDGTVFVINPDGTGYQTLYSFTGGSDGYETSGLLAVNGKLYGTTNQGGTDGDGTLFVINPDGTGFKTLYSFPNANGDGTNPYASLISVNGKLYGTTYRGGANNDGTVFAVNLDGTGYQTLYSFTGGIDGTNPTTSLLAVSGKLYGIMPDAGSNGNGSIYSVDPATHLETTLYSFQASSSSDGVNPVDSLIDLNGKLYGTTKYGGTSTFGTIFAVTIGVAPVANNDSAKTYYNTALTISAPGVLGNDTNGGISALTAALVTKPTHGTLTFNSDGSFTYIPNTGFLGTDSFTYQAVNNIGKSNVATCTLNVQPRTPIAVNNSNNVLYQTPLSVPAPGVLGNDSNGGSSPMTASLVTTVSHGTLTLNSNGAFIYTPAAGFLGTDSFTYQAVNSVGKSNTATATLVVQATVPTANNDHGTGYYNTVLTIGAPGVLGNDSNGGKGPLTAVLVTNPTHGTLTFKSDGSFVYTPSKGFVGTDSFTYKDTNSIGSSNMATVTLTINAKAPTAVNNSNNVKKNTTFTVPAPGVLGNDDNGGEGPLTAVLVTTTSHGTLTLNSNGAFTYTPNTNFTGTDSFTYQAVNSVGKSNVATATLIVQ